MQRHKEWIITAQDDLLSAQVLFKAQIFRNALYHCQQSAEKSLKSYLCFKNQPIIKTHDLVLLLQRCYYIDQEFIILKQHSNILNPYAIRTRYPDDFMLVTYEEIESMVKEAIFLAQEILELVQEKII